MYNLTCNIDGCDGLYSSRGLCNPHYQRAWKAGNLPAGRTPEIRFWAKVDKTATCWNWTGSRQGDGYGRFALNGKTPAAHRVSYEWANGPIEPGMEIDHKCHNRACVNPEHLRSVTRKQNVENLYSSKGKGSSGVRGVYWATKESKWRACVRHNGKSYYAGAYSELADAETAVIAKRMELFTHSDGR